MEMSHLIFIATSAVARAWNNRHIHSFTWLLNNQTALDFSTEKLNTCLIKKKTTLDLSTEKTTFKRRNKSGVRKTMCDFDSGVVSENMKITRYAKDGKIEDARQVFEKMTKRSVVSWNAMITGYACSGKIKDARQLFDEMPERDVVSWNSMVSGYVRNESLENARQLFDKMPERDVVSWDCMISGYARGGRMEEAYQLFNSMPEKNVITWNAMLVGYAQIGRIEDAQHLFDKMPERDSASWNMMIAAYAQGGRMLEARRLFDEMQEKNTVSWNLMITGYAQRGQMSDARELFDKMPVRDVVTWTAMVTGYAQNGNISDARRLFDKMPERNIISWNAMIAGYAQNGRMEDASHLFSSMPNRNVSSWNAMIAGFAQNGQIENARRLFDKMGSRDSLSWTVMIAGYSQNDHCEEALKMFSQMKHSGFKPVESTFTCVLSACANLAALEQGKQLHGISIKTGFEPGVFVGNAIVTMYCKCGSIDDAHCLFEIMPKRDVVSWNAIIAGYAQHGYGKEALQFFEQMQHMGIKPNRITLIGVLSACSHAGLVNKGEHYFHSMTKDHGIAATVEHYACMVDLLGRAGHLVEAEDFVNNMPIEPNGRVWGALLGASRIHGNIELGQRAAENIFELEPHNAGIHVLLFNMYVAAGRWNDATNLRLTMKQRGLKKEPGCSWIEIENKIHAFLVGDKSHPQTEKIYAMLARLAEQMKEAGYVPLKNFVLNDGD
ncbi:pentatricopeptide repeat-containing protein At4g02750 [Cryptomeria japonica]|uniref:pentatricopeptide repeat-containing protein At4g02750 n=1 Tax=Cryptomeria japonica TaxID=3369 RepID=UPI0027D9D7B2|nr:pentatricopeptide repeat-containing protein At4g02750 [Cryptomeria japonica]